ncbi:MAG: TIM barrel protein [Bacteroidota bacterium]|jgi:sugar phosphate isomerase/epimerase
MKNEISRRGFMSIIPAATLGIFLSRNAMSAKDSNVLSFVKPNSKFGGVQLGVITYSFRSMPHDIDQLLKFCIDANVSAIEMMGDPAEDFAGKPKNPNPFRMGPPPKAGQPMQRPTMTDEQKAQMADYNKKVAEWRVTASMEKFKEIRKKFNDAGVSIYAFKPNAFGANNSDAEIEYGMNAAKALGATSVTVELPTDAAQTQRLGDLGTKHKVYIGYHAHLQATDTLWDVALAQSPYNSMNLDCGHYIAVGGKNTNASLLALIEAKHDRITSMHLKDRTADGKNNLAWGQGDTPIKDILLLVKSKKYKFPITIELEYDVPEGSDAVKEVGKCIEFAKKILV